MSSTRTPVCAGRFYPAESATLQNMVENYLAAARLQPVHGSLRGLIVPHAGYIYSGPIAASGYAELRAQKERIKRVVLIGPSHHVWFHGLALPDTRSFATPLGQIQLDLDAINEIRSLPRVVTDARAHAAEHSLEVHLPFLQCVLGDFRLVPLVVGEVAVETVARVLEHLWDGAQTVFIISSDLSHYLPYAMARQTDQQTVDAILGLQGPLTPDQACGCFPVGGWLIAARHHQLVPLLLDMRNSGDITGTRDQVVGYAAIAFTEGDELVH